MGKSSSRKKKAQPDPNPTPNGNQNAQNENPNPPNPDSLHFLLKRAHDLKEEGNRLFQSKDYASALQSYQNALNILPHDHPERAVFHSNRAACLMLLRPIDHQAVVTECSLALKSQPSFPRALLRRARAYEALQKYDLALSDVRVLLEVDADNKDALELEKKVKDFIFISNAQQSRPSPAALGASAVRGAPVGGLGPCLPARASPVLKKATSPPPPMPGLKMNGSKVEKAEEHVENMAPLALKPEKANNASKAVAVVGETKIRLRKLKLLYDHDIRLGEMPEKCTFKQLREIVGKRFACAKAVLIKYKDEDGDLVTITNSKELRLAELSVDKGRKDEDGLGVLRLHIVEVNEKQEPVLIEEEDEVEVEEKVEQNVMEEQTKSTPSDENVSSAQEVEAMDVMPKEVGKEEESGVKNKDCDHAECKEVEIDNWLYEFAQLFRQQVGVDPDAHLDLHELGMELCTKALEETITSEEAQNLFELAAAKFQEVAALAFFNWGNVHMCAARKKIPLDESSPKEVIAAQLHIAYDWVRERYALAGEKYEEALRIKPDFYEGLLALGQQHFEMAKLHWSFALAKKIDLTLWDSSETIKLFDSAAGKMKSATEMWEKAEEKRVNEINNPSKKDEILKKHAAREEGKGELSVEEAAEQAAVTRSQIHLFWGNMLFERSQVELKLSIGDWKKNLDMAVERFKLAGASKADISVVLNNHASNASGSEGDENNHASLDTVSVEVKANGEDKHMSERQCIQEELNLYFWFGCKHILLFKSQLFCDDQVGSHMVLKWSGYKCYIISFHLLQLHATLRKIWREYSIKSLPPSNTCCVS